MSGWICSYRAIWEHPIFQGNAARVGVWDWLLKKAAWKPTKFRVGGEIIELQRGQLCISQAQVTEETGMARQQLRTFLTALEREGAIQTRPATNSTKGRTLISICKYDRYQLREKPPNQALTKEQPTKEQVNNSSPDGEGVPPPSSQLIEVSVVSSATWNAGKAYLASCGVPNPGAMIGRWLKSHKPLDILAAVGEAQKAGTQDPIPYISQVLKGETRDKPSKQEERLHAFVSGARGAP